jgi:hypothetical protein
MRARGRATVLATVLVAGLTFGCSPPGISGSADNDCSGVCEPFGSQFPGVGECVQGVCRPTFHECFAKSEHSTCESFCNSIGSKCAENECAGGTYLLHAILDWCQDPTKEGVAMEGGCTDPIGWQVSEAAQCCCEQ